MFFQMQENLYQRKRFSLLIRTLIELTALSTKTRKILLASVKKRFVMNFIDIALDFDYKKLKNIV